MPAKRRGGFFATESRPQDEEARRSDLEALIVSRRSVPQEIGVERIEPNPFQARRTFDGIEELAAAMVAQGFISRLRVRPHPQRPGLFQLVYGERRLRAAQAAGLREVPCEVADHCDEELIEIGLAENIQRRDLDPLDEARAFATCIEQRGYSIRHLAERIGKDKSYVDDRLALLRAPADVQQMIEQRPQTLRAAREIAKVSEAAQRQELIEGVVAGRLKTHDVRQQVRQATSQTQRGTGPAGETTAQTVARESSHIQAILAHWQQLAAQSPAQHALVSEQTALVLQAINELVHALER